MPLNVTVNIGGKDVANAVRKHLVRDPICKFRENIMRIFGTKPRDQAHLSLGYVTRLQEDFITGIGRHQ